MALEAVAGPNKPVRNGLFPLDVVDNLEAQMMPTVEAFQQKKGNKTHCTVENAAVRREWSDLSVPEREEYIKAVLCLQKLPAKAPKDQFPGAVSRFDDFVAFHMTQAMMLHDPQHLFASHKYFIWTYEKALREECGYTGYQPYMNYDRYAQDPIHSSMFNGNASSMGGNGAPSNYNGVIQPFRKPYDKIPPAGGGGCVTEGPFKDMVVSLGPKAAVVNNVPKNPQEDGLGSNPRCLRRDVNRNSALGATANYTYSLIMDNKDVDSFYNRYLGQPQLKNDTHPWGLHNAGHYMIGGDPGGDFYCSPGDPAFYFHHGMLDRVWWIWQMQDPDNRINAIPGMGAMPMSMSAVEPVGRRNAAADIIVDFGFLAPPVPLTDLLDQLGGNKGQFCYIYV
ncbi:putative domain, di-copper centre [Niveomyces insectorum RCEF 264]|uniref:Putative domain, di-copper centre n=1 Tax=Niveomyces insectorum RCEF 264 TaxID=1081102 RepID=A0A162MRN0_9HYPO|nr:putative domain, di-copper centre [Niveomyces insectorum RCEF 264]